MNRRFQLVDVFHERPLSGNPLAVVFDADDMSVPEMQAMTRWLNLSETAFLQKPTHAEADYRVRIFTLDREMPFAGHPTLGSCHAWLTAGGHARDPSCVIQECGVGLVRVQRANGLLSFAAPQLLRSGAVEEAYLQEIAEFLGIARTEIIDAQWADNGPGWVVVLLESAQAVLKLEPKLTHPQRIDLGVVGAYPPGSPQAFELRALFSDPFGNVNEDPVTGILNASVAQWLLATGRAQAPYVASQGTRLGRTGRVQISVDDKGVVWVGGNTETLFSGTCLV